MSNVIFVTGFGPFVGHEEKNASWEAVKLLPDKVKVKNQEYSIKKIEIPVKYDVVDNVVNKIWSENPRVTEIIKSFN
jgi:pyroglutamyl-peptidase